MNENVRKGRGRPAKPIPEPNLVFKAIVHFLQVFMTETLAIRVVSMVLLAAGFPNEKITNATGLGERSIWTLKKAMRDGDIDAALEIRHRSGRPMKARGIESAIVEEVEKGNYHNRQQIADMVEEKFGISMSVSAVGKLLKKTASGG